MTCSFIHRLCLLVAVLSGSFLFLPVARAAEEEAGDVEILCAFQERFLADRGVPCDWQKNEFEGSTVNNPGWPNPPLPAEGTFSSAQIDAIINNIFSFLKRYDSNVQRPLFYLTDADVEGGKTWGDVRKKLVRIVHGGQVLTMPEKRRLITQTLRRQRLLATALKYNGLKRRQTPSTLKSEVPATPPNPASIGGAAAYFAADPWSTNFTFLPSMQLNWQFIANPSGNYFRTSYSVYVCDMGLAPHLSGIGFMPVLSMERLSMNWSADADRERVLTVLEEMGFPLRQSRAYFMLWLSKTYWQQRLEDLISSGRVTPELLIELAK